MDGFCVEEVLVATNESVNVLATDEVEVEGEGEEGSAFCGCDEELALELVETSFTTIRDSPPLWLVEEDVMDLECEECVAVGE